jgi:hypothetical protein
LHFPFHHIRSLQTFTAKLALFVPPRQFSIAHFTWRFSHPGRLGKWFGQISQSQGNPLRKARSHRKQKDFWTSFPRYLIIYTKDWPKIINDDSVSEFSSSSQTDHGKSDNSGDENDFLNELSRQFESNEKLVLTNTSDEIETRLDLLEGSDNGKSADWYHVTNSLNGVSMKPSKDKNSMLTLTHDGITMGSNIESSFKNQDGIATHPIPAEIDWRGGNRC